MESETSQQQQPERARMFIALDLPSEVGDALARWGERALDDPALRRTPRPSLHVTLAFLGSTPLAAVETIEAALAGAAGEAPRVELLDAVGRPGRAAPRLFALPVLSEETERLQERVCERLVGARLFEPEKRPFWPHVTVARVRPRRGSKGRPMAVEEPPGKLPASLREPFFCRRLTLYRSQLQPRGAVYTPLAQVELPKGRQ